MNLSSAAERMKEQISSLLSLMDDENIEYLRSYCISVGYDAIQLEMRSNQMELMNFVIKGIRTGYNLEDLSDIDFPLRVLGAFYYLQGSLRTIEAIHYTTLESAADYEQIVETSGHCWSKIRYCYFEAWPFGGLNPFYSRL